MLLFHHDCFNPCYLFSQSPVPCFFIKMRLILICSFFSLFSSLIDVIVGVKKYAFLFCRHFFFGWKFLGSLVVMWFEWFRRNRTNEEKKTQKKKIHWNAGIKADWKTDNRLMNYSENTRNYMVSYVQKNYCETSHRMRSLHNKCNDEAYTFHVYLITFGRIYIVIYCMLQCFSSSDVMGIHLACSCLCEGGNVLVFKRSY